MFLMVSLDMKEANGPRGFVPECISVLGLNLCGSLTAGYEADLFAITPLPLIYDIILLIKN